MKAIFYLMAIASLLTFSSFTNETPGKSNTSNTTSIKGKIIDKQNGESLAGVKVFIEGTNSVTYTDFDGNFEFNHLDSNKDYSISTSLISYKKSTYKKSEINKEKNLTITLEHVK